MVNTLVDGNERSEQMNEDGVNDLLYDLKETGTILWITFDRGDKVKRVAVMLK